MSTTTRGEALSGAEKVAIMMLALSEEHAASLLARLDHHEVVQISQIMAGLGPVDEAVVARLLREFDQQLTRRGTVVGGVAAAERLLLRSLDAERADAVLEEIRGPATGAVWGKLAGVDEAVLASYLRNEHPQTVAVVLARLEPTHAARVLASLPDDFATDIVLRMLEMGAVREDVVADVERTLRAELMGGLGGAGRRDNHALMAEILNHADPAMEARLIQAVGDRDQEAAERIRALMFTFEDLDRLDGSGIQTLIRTAGSKPIATALKGATEPLRELFFKNMSERGAKILRDDMQSMGPVRLKEVQAAQQLLVGMAKELAASGQITLRDDQDDQLVA